MRLVSATLYALKLPFIEAFRHATKDRTFSDSVVVQVRDDAGNVGFGEGVPRPYVTGETQAGMIGYLRERLWAMLRGSELPAPSLQDVDTWVPEQSNTGVLADHSTRAALTTAILDCTLRAAQRSLADLAEPRRSKVIYSGVITAGSVDKAIEHARQMKLAGLRQVKLKVGFVDDVVRLRAVRDVLGPDVSLRIDANGAWRFDEAVTALEALAPYAVDVVEQPMARGTVDELARLRAVSPIPIMVDESLVTLDDARVLAAARAVDYFNVRVSKCGGLHRSLAVAQIAYTAGIKVQVGSLVGETAILSAVGRHLAATLEDVAFVEGSYGTLLLAEDVAAQSIRFGHRGEAAILRGPGLGVEVRPAILSKYAVQQVELS